ncbi:outer spore coat protein CotE [Bacillus massiliigorillae]|uniref:outer spore coat protein CotE n=1 Tax=Bacillus massiliigorillae TaxID=1243664 RepID=UPI0003A24115|nr:outer spore coat protein CotE [Bacillus massiliigorillae]
MSHYREIITKAVVAKGRKFTKSCETIKPAHCPSSILGCWLINHHYTAKKVGKTVHISGSFDVSVWYSYNNNTKTDVATETVKYTDVVKLKYRDPNCHDDREIVVKVIQQPNCVEACIASCGKNVEVEVEKEFFVEVIGETKVCVAISPNSEACDDDDWFCDVDDDEFEEINPDFIINSDCD